MQVLNSSRSIKTRYWEFRMFVASFFSYTFFFSENYCSYIFLKHITIMGGTMTRMLFIVKTIDCDLYKRWINVPFCSVIFSEEDYDAFCLAYMFTYRDFEMGTLGLAWTGDLKNAGGVCEKNGVSMMISSTVDKIVGLLPSPSTGGVNNWTCASHKIWNDNCITAPTINAKINYAIPRFFVRSITGAVWRAWTPAL